MDNKELTKLVSSFLLGDGHLRKWANRPNLPAAYGLSQVDKHKGYVEWQRSVLSNITSSNLLWYPPSVKDGVSRQGVYKLETKSHPFFETLRERWYHDGKKTVSLHDIRQMDWQMLAIWYMDDGYIINSPHKSHDGNVFLCTDCFSEAEVVLLQKAVYDGTGVAMDIRQRGKKTDGTRIYRLCAKNRQAEDFRNGVKPHMFESFFYKLRTEGPSTEGDDIVCTSQECEESGGNDQTTE